MLGDLDHPPIIIKKSRAKSFLMLLVSAAFSAALLFTWPEVRRTSSEWLLLPGLILCGLGVPLFAWELYRPEKLILSPSGLEWKSIRKTLTFKWSELSEFSIHSIHGSKLIGFTAPTEGRVRKSLARLNTALTGQSAAIPGLWEITPEKVAAILNSARTKWAANG